ncbi:MAG: class I SAM-dependent methyltransferase [Balneolales bacterium]|nr:class I SAM-dependent methyltransferase [Balneolales bacterium]
MPTHCPCPLCNFEKNTADLVSQDDRIFGKCVQCSLIYCNPSAHPTITLEQERYDTHLNTPENPGYRSFLSRAVDPVLEILRTNVDSAKPSGDAKHPSTSLRFPFPDGDFEVVKNSRGTEDIVPDGNTIDNSRVDGIEENFNEITRDGIPNFAIDDKAKTGDHHLRMGFNMRSENTGRSGLHALDFGCGPGPVLSLILRENGIRCVNYDPIYYPDWPETTFNLIFSTETFEHFHQPGETISQINDLLQPGGILCVMTEQWTDISRFSSWSYTRDDTHVCFYHTDTFQWICEKFGYEILYNDRKRVIILQKRPTS